MSYNCLRAPMLAAFYVILMYLLVIHLFVLWKWETSPEIDELFIEMEYDAGLDVVPETTDSILNQTAVDELKREAHLAPQAKSDHQEAVKKLASFHAKIMNWDGDTRLPKDLGSSAVLPDGNKSIETLRITSLLLRKSLSEARDPVALNSVVDVAIKEFEGLSHQKMEVQWKGIHELLFPPEGSSNEYPAKEKLSEEELLEMICTTKEEKPIGGDPSGLAENQDMELYVQNDDLESYFMELKRILQEREQNFTAYLQGLGEGTFVSETIEESAKGLRQDFSESQTLIDNEIEEFVTQIRADSAVGEDMDLGHCVAEEDVLALVEEGLNALHRRGDLRSALLQKLTELDPESAEGLILDAVLDARSPAPKPTPSKTINVRRALDTPVVRHLIATIDWFARLVQDHTRQAVPAVRTSSSIEKRIVQLTGPEVTVPAWARKLLMRTKRGADLLMS